MSEGVCEICGRPAKANWDGPYNGRTCARGYPVNHPAGMDVACCRVAVARLESELKGAIDNYATYEQQIARLESELREARRERDVAARAVEKLVNERTTLSAERTARQRMREAIEWVLAHQLDSPKSAEATLRAALAAEPGEGAATPEALCELRTPDHRGPFACCGKRWCKEHFDGHAAVHARNPDGSLAPPEGHPRAAEVKND